MDQSDSRSGAAGIQGVLAVQVLRDLERRGQDRWSVFEGSRPQARAPPTLMRSTRAGVGEGKPRTDRIYGLAACAAVARMRPLQVQRLHLTRGVSDRFSELMRAMAAAKRAYNLVSAGDLQALADSPHHEGVVMDVRVRPRPEWRELLPDRDGQALLLDRVDNPHNIGAICRSAAHFGAAGLMAVSGPRSLKGAAARVAEGGAEHVVYRAVGGPEECARAATERGWTLIGLDGASGRRLDESLPHRRVVWVIGSERDGLSDAARAACAQVVSIQGTGAVESLNASVAAAVAMSVWSRGGGSR